MTEMYFAKKIITDPDVVKTPQHTQILICLMNSICNHNVLSCSNNHLFFLPKISKFMLIKSFLSNMKLDFRCPSDLTFDTFNDI